MSLHVIEFDSRRAGQRMYESINAELQDVATLIRACGIPKPFDATLEAVDPVRWGIPHNFLLRIGWEGRFVAATIDGYTWIEAESERPLFIENVVRSACYELLRGVMADRREAFCRREQGVIDGT